MGSALDGSDSVQCHMYIHTICTVVKMTGHNHVNINNMPSGNLAHAVT